MSHVEDYELSVFEIFQNDLEIPHPWKNIDEPYLDTNCYLVAANRNVTLIN